MASSSEIVKQTLDALLKLPISEGKIFFEAIDLGVTYKWCAGRKRGGRKTKVILDPKVHTVLNTLVELGFLGGGGVFKYSLHAGDQKHLRKMRRLS